MTHMVKTMREIIVVTTAELASGTEMVKNNIGHIDLRKARAMTVCDCIKDLHMLTGTLTGKAGKLNFTERHLLNGIRLKMSYVEA